MWSSQDKRALQWEARDMRVKQGFSSAFSSSPAGKLYQASGFSYICHFGYRKKSCSQLNTWMWIRNKRSVFWNVLLCRKEKTLDTTIFVVFFMYFCVVGRITLVPGPSLYNLFLSPYWASKKGPTKKIRDKKWPRGIKEMDQFRLWQIWSTRFNCFFQSKHPLVLSLGFSFSIHIFLLVHQKVGSLRCGSESGRFLAFEGSGTNRAWLDRQSWYREIWAKNEACMGLGSHAEHVNWSWLPTFLALYLLYCEGVKCQTSIYSMEKKCGCGGIHNVS